MILLNIFYNLFQITLLVTSYLIKRPCKSDPCIAAKCLSIILSSLQYTQKINSFESMDSLIEQMTSFIPSYSICPSKKEYKYRSLSKTIGNVIHSKIQFYSQNPLFDGNFHILPENASLLVENSLFYYSQIIYQEVKTSIETNNEISIYKCLLSLLL